MATIRKMAQTDLVQCARIEESALDAWSMEQLEEEFENPVAQNFVIQNEERIVGFCSFHYSCGEASLNTFTIHQAMRGSGWGKKLLSHCIAYFKEKQAHMIYLEVRSQNQSACALYEKLGFQQVQVRKGFYKKPDDDALCMILNLEESSC
ncbi:MAG: ribosomal protein S18-alanine N-acetyltransferase [Oscillospiraceae bacterium]|nr:ribosomal protein S18-alanine N-acetyltransferase [Oscillospiraceae bacterium]